MSKHPTSPCVTCPYRRDSALGFWDRDHYQSVADSENAQGLDGSIFSCHKHHALPAKEQGICAGWLLDQKRRDLPSNALRFKLLRDPDACEALEQVTDGGLEVMDAETMVRVNLIACDLIDEKRGQKNDASLAVGNIGESAEGDEAE